MSAAKSYDSEYERLVSIIRRAGRSKGELVELLADYMLLYREGKRLKRALTALSNALEDRVLALDRRNAELQSAIPKPKKTPLKVYQARFTDNIDALKAKHGFKYRSEAVRFVIRDSDLGKLSDRQVKKLALNIQKMLLPEPAPITIFEHLTREKKKGAPRKKR